MQTMMTRKNPGVVPPEYRGLHKYLRDRFADTVVLTFSEIEDLLGWSLPDAAREEAEWWANADASGAQSAQSLSWTLAGRTAAPRGRACVVVFDHVA